MKPKLVISGAAGRMGRRIISTAIDEEAFDIIAAIDRKGHPDIAANLAGPGQTPVKLTADWPADADVVIDFSAPAGADVSAKYCRDNKAALVVGSTGLTEQQLAALKEAAQKTAVVHAANMSVGMNLLFALVSKAAAMLGEDYDVEIVEAHHRFKKDAPSGSALTLARNIADAAGKDYPACLVHGRSGKDALRKKGTIGIHAVRAGDITGEHKVMFSAVGETVTLAHSAHSRDTFARGALRAAKWALEQKPGLYSMADVLAIK